MANCTNCGAELTGRFCENCGLEAPDYVAPEQKAAQEAPKGAPLTSQPYINDLGAAPAAPQTSVVGWLGWIALISYVPIIGIVIALIVAKDESVKNFTKAYLILWGISFVLSIIVWIALIAFITGVSHSL